VLLVFHSILVDAFLSPLLVLLQVPFVVVLIVVVGDDIEFPHDFGFGDDHVVFVEFHADLLLSGVSLLVDDVEGVARELRFDVALLAGFDAAHVDGLVALGQEIHHVLFRLVQNLALCVLLLRRPHVADVSAPSLTFPSAVSLALRKGILRTLLAEPVLVLDILYFYIIARFTLIFVHQFILLYIVLIL